jgi:hypothetical protein
MTSALTYKEFRENVGIAALGLAALLLVASQNMGWTSLSAEFGFNERQGPIPFLNDSFNLQFAVVAVALAVALGLRQSLGDFFGDAYLFLLHRPVSRIHIVTTKLAMGLTLYLLCTGATILLYSWWASLPGTHASPFEWSMTGIAWIVMLAITPVYLGAFLTGLRPAAWFGTRLAPLAAALVATSLCFSVPLTLGASLLLVCDGLLVVLILFVAETRDYA